MKKVIIFDFDNTIVMSLKYWKKVIEKETAKKYKVSENLYFAEKRHGYSNIDTAKLFLKMHSNVPATYNKIIDYWYSYMQDKYTNNVNFVAGAYQFLQNLKQKGYKLILATATGKILLEKALKIFNLQNFFDRVICEEEIGKSKKEPDIYYKIMQEFKVKPKDCLYFEDSLIAITTANKLGIDCVAMINNLNKSNLNKFNNLCIKTAKRYSNKLMKELNL